MGYMLFIDDERYPVDDSWIIARTYDEAIMIIHDSGFPDFISFDHDLGDNSKTGFDVAKWLVEYMLDNNISKIEYYVHSQNPVGKKNIECLLNGYMNSCRC